MAQKKSKKKIEKLPRAIKGPDHKQDPGKTQAAAGKLYKLVLSGESAVLIMPEIREMIREWQGYENGPGQFSKYYPNATEADPEDCGPVILSYLIKIIMLESIRQKDLKIYKNFCETTGLNEFRYGFDEFGDLMKQGINIASILRVLVKVLIKRIKKTEWGQYDDLCELLNFRTTIAIELEEDGKKAFRYVKIIHKELEKVEVEDMEGDRKNAKKMLEKVKKVYKKIFEAGEPIKYYF